MNSVLLFRPILQAVTVWDLEPVAWMLQGDKKVDEDVEQLVGVRKKTEPFVKFAKQVSSLMGQTKKGPKAAEVTQHMQTSLKVVQAGTRWWWWW